MIEYEAGHTCRPAIGTELHKLLKAVCQILLDMKHDAKHVGLGFYLDLHTAWGRSLNCVKSDAHLLRLGVGVFIFTPVSELTPKLKPRHPAPVLLPVCSPFPPVLGALGGTARAAGGGLIHAALIPNCLPFLFRAVIGRWLWLGTGKLSWDLNLNLQWTAGKASRVCLVCS